jgi:hypothetical protein
LHRLCLHASVGLKSVAVGAVGAVGAVKKLICIKYHIY